MEKEELPEATLEDILDTARYAPSVHNTQPWKVRKNGRGLTITIDKNHRLSAGDPVNRQTIISLGIFTEAICIAAEDLGLAVKETKFSHEQVAITFDTGRKTGGEMSKLLRKRASDRSIFSPIKISKSSEELIKGSSREKSVKLWVIDDRDFIQTLSELTSKGIRLALSNPEFRTELSKYLVRPISKKNRGIAIKSLYIPWLAGALQPEILKTGLNTGKEADLEKKRWLSATAVVLITTEGDFSDDWFEAGKAYLRASLAIEKAGLSQATSAAAVEASNFHEDVEALLGTKQRLQAAIRIGKGAKRRYYSPRVSVKEIIA